MTDRAAFLDRLRARIADADAAPRIALADVGESPPLSRFADAPAGLDGFRRAWEALGGVLHLAHDAETLARAVDVAVDRRSPVLIGGDPLVTGLAGDLRWPDCGLAAAATAQVGVVGARAAIAATGSLVVDAAFGHGRSASLLPPVGVFVVEADTIRDTPGDVLRGHRELFPEGPPSQVVLVTGPSRSADIEMTLTVGVHGPGEVHAIVIDPSRGVHS